MRILHFSRIVPGIFVNKQLLAYCTFTRSNATVVSGNVLFNQVGEWKVVVSGTGLSSYTYLIRVV